MGLYDNIKHAQSLYIYAIKRHEQNVYLGFSELNPNCNDMPALCPFIPSFKWQRSGFEAHSQEIETFSLNRM